MKGVHERVVLLAGLMAFFLTVFAALLVAAPRIHAHYEQTITAMFNEETDE